MKIRLIRHATLWVEYGGKNILIDPMFSDVGVNPPIVNSANDRRNPLVSMPVSMEDVNNPDMVVVTHTHRDHWDEAAVLALPKSTPIYCQPNDHELITSQGFQSVTAIDDTFIIDGLKIIRTSGQHGTGVIGQKMGPVSGFVLKEEGEPTLYIAGDTIWCDEVRQALETFTPNVTIVNAGGARFVEGDPITMDSEDIVKLCEFAPSTQVIAVHMDTINHCLVTREDLKTQLRKEDLLNQVKIPNDGEWV